VLQVQGPDLAKPAVTAFRVGDYVLAGTIVGALMRGESEKGAATRLRIMRTAADLFHKQGVGATSPDEILEASRAGKGQFYHYFGGKEGLVHQVLQSYIEDVESGAGPVDYEIRSWEELERWFASHIEMQKRFRMLRGCPFGTIGNGVTAKDELIRQ